MARQNARWITVANRLPFSLSADGNQIRQSSGGLVSALSGVKGSGERIWIGCAPDGLSRDDWPRVQKILSTAEQAWRYHPVFIEDALYDSYYNGFCNDVLWPLLHYHSELAAFDTAHWSSYQQVNERIAQEIHALVEDDDLIWIHDFHLFSLPKLLKQLNPCLRIGFFLHIPFPSSELFRQLPVREELLRSILASDLVGFHDYSYLQHFCASVLRLLGLESEFLAIRHKEHVTRLGVFPVSIDTDRFLRNARDPKVRSLSQQMSRSHFVFLGVDRLDYMKGLDLKLKAFRTLLRKFPQYREKVSLVQVAVPTRQGVPVYMKLASDTARLVGEINGEFSTPTWSPVHYIHSSVTGDQLAALYRSADALLVSSKRDGMNLVALEYVASQDEERPGVVLLSEFTGASSTMSHALPINPWDLEATARQMRIAMEMPRQEKIFRQKAMQDYLRRYTATDWAESFIGELEKQTSTPRVGPEPISLEAPFIDRLAHRLTESKPVRVVLFLDYDGTVVPIEASPELAVLPPATKRELRRLTRYPWLDLVVISGRDSRFLERELSGVPVGIAAEHGAKFMDRDTGKWRRRILCSRTSWYPSALKIMSDYSARVPGSQIEKKHFSIAWHYRQSPQDYAEVQARKLAQELELGLANLPVGILRGKKVIEVRAIEADKGVFARAYLETLGENVISLAIGDDRTDEDLFTALKGRGTSIFVGHGASQADYALTGQARVLPFLQLLLASIETRRRGAKRGVRLKNIMAGVGEKMI